MYSRQATESVNCENYSVSFVMKYCPTSTVVRNPASVKILITRFCCESLSTRSSYFCKRSLLVQDLRSMMRCFHLDTDAGWESIPLRSSRALVSLSLDTVIVGEVDELEEDVG